MPGGARVGTEFSERGVMRATRLLAALLATPLLLTLRVETAAAQSIDVTVDPVGRVDAKSGVATITGTYRCDADFFGVHGIVQQDVGRFTMLGTFAFGASGACDGTTRSWSADVVPENGRFRGGKALMDVFAVSCNLPQPFTCATDVEVRTVTLHGGPA
jgi:hypothetical protein